MLQKTPAFWTALYSAGAEWRYGIDILAADEATALEDPTIYDQNASDRLVPKSATVTLDTTARTHRSFQLSFRNTDGRYLPGLAGLPSGGKGSPTATGLVWIDVRYRPWIELRTSFDASGNKVWDKTYLGVYVLVKPQAQVKSFGSQITINLLDKSALLCDPYFITNATLPTFTKNGHTVGGYASGRSFDSVMSDLATRGGIPVSKQLFSPGLDSGGSVLNLPADYSISENTEWWTHLQLLAASMAHVIYFDGTGNLVRIPNPLLQNVPSGITFTPGPQCVISEVDRETDFGSTYNHIIVAGGSSQTATYRGEAQILDQTNPYAKAHIGDRVCFIGKDGKVKDQTPDPTIGSTLQATRKAQVYLAQHLGQQEIVTIKCRNIPAIEPYDRFTVNVAASGLNTDFLAQKLSWQLAHDGMQIDSTKWFTVGG